MKVLKAFCVIVALVLQVGAEPVVQLSTGLIRGSTTNSGVSRFLGVPYAEPPLRWRSPKAKVSWSGVRDAFKSGPKCPQMDSFYKNIRSDGTSEDCLFLDVYAPASFNSSSNCLPVMLFIHGGCYQTGSAEDCDGSSWAERGLAVSVNIQCTCQQYSCIFQQQTDSQFQHQTDSTSSAFLAANPCESEPVMDQQEISASRINALLWRGINKHPQYVSV